MSMQWGDVEWTEERPTKQAKKKKSSFKRPPFECWDDTFSLLFNTVYWENEFTQLGLDKLLEATKEHPGTYLRWPCFLPTQSVSYNKHTVFQRPLLSVV